MKARLVTLSVVVVFLTLASSARDTVLWRREAIMPTLEYSAMRNHLHRLITTTAGGAASQVVELYRVGGSP